MAQRPVCVLRSDVAGFESIPLARDRSTIVIGRSRSVDYRIDHPQVSGLQCTVRLEQPPGTRVLVTDSSTNGTFVDGEEVARGETRELRSGALMTLLVATTRERDAEFAEEIPCFRVEMRPARPRSKQATPSSRAAARADAGTVDRPRRASTAGLATPTAKRLRRSAPRSAKPMLAEEEGKAPEEDAEEDPGEQSEEQPTLDCLLACELLTMVLSMLSSVAMLQASACCKRLHAAASMVDEIKLNAPRSTMTPPQAERLFGRFSLLRSLRLHGRCLSFGPACALVSRLLPRLELLDLRGNELTGVGAITMAEQLQAAAHAPRTLPLHTLELRNASLCATKLPGQLADEPTAALRLIGALRFAERLVRLNLSGNALKPTTAATIAEALLGPGSRLLELQLEQNYLGDEGARVLALALTPHVAPKDDASPPSPNASGESSRPAAPHGVDGAPPDDGSSAASRAPPPLLELRLDENFLTCACCPELSGLLAANATLQRLGLSNNGIDGTGGMQLVDGLALNSTLALLDLSRNMFLGGLGVPGPASRRLLARLQTAQRKGLTLHLQTDEPNEL